MTPAPDGPPRWGGADGPEVVCLSASPSDSPPPQKYQAEIVAFPRRAVRKPRRRRLFVRIAATDGHAPIGRSRPFRLTLDEVFELIAHLESIEARRR